MVWYVYEYVWMIDFVCWLIFWQVQVVEKYDVVYVIVLFVEKWLVYDLNFYIIMVGENFNNEWVMVMIWIFGEGCWFFCIFFKVVCEVMFQDGVFMGVDGFFVGRILDYLIGKDMIEKFIWNFFDGVLIN